MTALLLPTLLSPQELLETPYVKEPLGLDCAHPQDVLICRLAFALRAGGSTQLHSVLLACKGEMGTAAVGEPPGP